jgi:AcrR family transcriptional regulator
MSEAGLTKGGFYARFESKDALVAETVRLEADAVARDAVLVAGRRAAYLLADVAPEGRAKGLSA